MEEQRQCAKKKQTIKLGAQKLSTLHLFIIGTIIGAIFFLVIYGFSVLNITNDSWIMAQNSDTTQHYLGWEYYRNSDWNLKIGLIDNLVYPNRVSIIYMDSIPLFAILFKLLSGILPDTFQYFGLYGIMSFMLQYGITAIILQKINKNTILSLVGAMFSLLMPVLYQRMFIHTALTSHWIILLAFYICLLKENQRYLWQKILTWGGICFLAVSTHMYFLPIIVIIMSFYLLDELILRKKWIDFFIVWCSAILIALFAMFILGAFEGNASVMEAGGLGYYSANINALFNPSDTSYFLRSLPSATDGQYEGFSYLGFGMIVALILSIGALIATKKLAKMRALKRHHWISILGIIVIAILSYSPEITINDRSLIELAYPNILIKALTIFRCTGRFHWTVMYFAMLMILSAVIRLFEIKKALFVLLICLILQVSDISGYISSRADMFKNDNYISKLNSPAWNNLSQNFDHIVFIANKGSSDYYYLNYYYDTKTIFDITKYALENNMTINDSYVARRDVDAINSYQASEWQNIINHNANQDTLYLFPTIPFEALQNDYLDLYQIDGFIVGTKNQLTSQKIDIDNVSIILSGRFLTGGEDTAEGRVLNEGGISFGPYFTLEKGIYSIVVEGSNLDKAVFNVAANFGKTIINPTAVIQRSDLISYRFELIERTQNVEFRFYNNSLDTIILQRASLKVSSDLMQTAEPR